MDGGERVFVRGRVIGDDDIERILCAGPRHEQVNGANRVVVVTPSRIDEARLFLVLVALVEEHLRSKGDLVLEDDFVLGPMPGVAARELQQAHEDHARSVLGFPSFEAYARWQRLIESLRRRRAPDVEDLRSRAALEALVGSVGVECEVMLFPTETEAGVVEAERAAKAAIEALEHGDDWYGLPGVQLVSMRRPSGGGGYFRERTLYGLRSALGESEYSLFLRNDSVADRVFFDIAPGRLGGPFRGPKGLYIVRVFERSEPTLAWDPSDRRQREFAELQLLRTELRSLAHALLQGGLADGTVRGL
jgi:hypothetical protein